MVTQQVKQCCTNNKYTLETQVNPQSCQQPMPGWQKNKPRKRLMVKTLSAHQVPNTHRPRVRKEKPISQGKESLARRAVHKHLPFFGRAAQIFKMGRQAKKSSCQQGSGISCSEQQMAFGHLLECSKTDAAPGHPGLRRGLPAQLFQGLGFVSSQLRSGAKVMC